MIKITRASEIPELTVDTEQQSPEGSVRPIAVRLQEPSFSKGRHT
jgi:hypothetical protein